jgi:hypothetical protein
MSGEDPGKKQFSPSPYSSVVSASRNTIFTAESLLLLFRLARSHYNWCNGGQGYDHAYITYCAAGDRSGK